MNATLSHPSASAWLAAIAVWLTLVALHALAVGRLARSRPAEAPRTVKPRSVGLLALTFINPSLPLSALVVLLLLYKSYMDGLEPMQAS